MATQKETEQAFNPGKGFEGEDDYEQGDWQDADDFLGAAVPSVAWPEIGASVSGTVQSVVLTDQTEPDGKVRTFPNGQVRKQAVITLQTAEHETDDDDGRRRLFVKGFMVKPFREALAAAHVKGVRPGGLLTVTFTGEGEQKQKGLNKPKLFTVQYDPPQSN